MSGFGLWTWRALPLVAALGLVTAAAATPPAASSAPDAGPAVPLRLPAPIVYAHAVGPDSAVTFRHETHVALAGYRCLGCHPAPFRMLGPSRRVVHADMASGGSCGQCHDGRGAFGVADSSACQTCHAGREKASLTAPPTAGRATPRKLPGPIAFERGESSPGDVRFRHDTHVKDGTACSSCHPKPFAMRTTGGRPGGAMHEAAGCGACHDGARAFAAENAEACARCHREPGGKR